MKKIMILSLIGMCVLGLPACGTSSSGGSDSSSAADSSASAESTVSTVSAGSVDDGENMPNPFVEYESLEEALEHLDFTADVPDFMEGYEARYYVMSDSVLQIIFENQYNEICIRKEAGEEDISGDYNEYDQEEDLALDEKTLHAKGKDDLIYTVTWTDNGYSYSITIEQGMMEEDILDLAARIV